MNGPIRMVLISITASTLFAVCFYLYRKRYPKKKINLLVLLIIISLLPTISIFRGGVYESGDFNIHIYRIIDFYKSLSEGNIVPSWAGNLNATYGYPLFIFNYQLPYYLISFLHFLGFTFIASMKIYIAANIVISGIAMFLFSYHVLKNKFSAFASSIFYVFAPYHLVSVHFKVALGEMTVFSIIPFIFLLIYKFSENKKKITLLYIALLIFLLFQSHAALAVLSCTMFVLYIFHLLHKNHSMNLLPYYFLSFISGLILSSYIIIAPIIFRAYTITSKEIPTTAEFPKIYDLLFSPWMYGFLFQGHMGEISNLIGYTQLTTVIIIFFLIAKKKIKKIIANNVIFWMVSFFITLFFITEYSKFIWDNALFLTPIGSHRLLILLAFITSILAGYLSLIARKKIVIFILIITIFSTILNWGHRRMITNISDQTLIKNVPESTFRGEGHFYANSVWVKNSITWFKNIPKNHMELTSGEGKIINLERSTTKHVYLIYAKTTLNLTENTLYFPGWTAKIDNKIISTYPDSLGRISISAPSGNYILTIEYKDINVYKISKVVSIFGFIVVLLIISFNCLLRYRKTNLKLFL